jgi:hypothetical protein
MADQEQLQRLFPDTSLPSVLPLPKPPEDPEEAVIYLRILHDALNSQQAKLVRALNVLKAYSVSIDPEVQNLPAIGSGRLNIDPDTGYAYYDAPIRESGLSDSDIISQAEWRPLRVEASALAPISLPSFGVAFGMVLEPVVAGGLPPNICLGDKVVVRETPPATEGPTLDQPSDFLWTVEGDIVMADVSGFYS